MKNKMFPKRFLAIVFLGLGMLASAVGQTEATVALDVSGGDPTGGSAARTVGVEFTPKVNILVTSLGVYYRGFYADAPVGIWRVSDQRLLASVTVPKAGGTLVGKFRYLALSINNYFCRLTVKRTVMRLLSNTFGCKTMKFSECNQLLKGLSESSIAFHQVSFPVIHS